MIVPVARPYIEGTDLPALAWWPEHKPVVCRRENDSARSQWGWFEEQHSPGGFRVFLNRPQVHAKVVAAQGPSNIPIFRLPNTPGPDHSSRSSVSRDLCRPRWCARRLLSLYHREMSRRTRSNGSHSPPIQLSRRLNRQSTVWEHYGRSRFATPE